MDPRYIAPPPDSGLGLPAEIARFGAAGLSLRLTSLQQKLEREHPLTVALEIADREAVDGLPPGLTVALHAMSYEAALAAAAHAGATLIEIALRVGANGAMLHITDDGVCAAGKGIFDLGEWRACGIGPRSLAELVAASGGRLRFDSRVAGCRLEIVVPRDPAARLDPAIMPPPPLAAAG